MRVPRKCFVMKCVVQAVFMPASRHCFGCQWQWTSRGHLHPAVLRAELAKRLVITWRAITQSQWVHLQASHSANRSALNYYSLTSPPPHNHPTPRYTPRHTHTETHTHTKWVIQQNLSDQTDTEFGDCRQSPQNRWWGERERRCFCLVGLWAQALLGCVHRHCNE